MSASRFQKKDEHRGIGCVGIGGIGAGISGGSILGGMLGGDDN
ncbi:MAG: hypothetical protein PHO01_07535 [Desulfotomaculaceae bacterium]|nr:hypothetical protein [Desulfotomaculaceae bacterium]